MVNQFSPDRAKKLPASKEELTIKFVGDREGSHRLHFTASGVLDLADGPGWQTNSPIRDKIVLLGGAYAASDEHHTPLGWMLGVEVLASIIETELQGGGTRPPNRMVIILMGILSGLTLLLLFHHFWLGTAVLLSVIAIPILAMACSLVAFWSLAFWSYFVPVLIAILSQQLYDQAKEYRKRFVRQLYEGVVGTPRDTDASAEGQEKAAPRSIQLAQETQVASPTRPQDT